MKKLLVLSLVLGFFPELSGALSQPELDPIGELEQKIADKQQEIRNLERACPYPRCEALATCQSDSDCVLVYSTCCGCSSSGSGYKVSVPVSNQAAYEADLNHECSQPPMVCLMDLNTVCAGGYEAVCVNSKCTAQLKAPPNTATPTPSCIRTACSRTLDEARAEVARLQRELADLEADLEEGPQESDGPRGIVYIVAVNDQSKTCANIKIGWRDSQQAGQTRCELPSGWKATPMPHGTCPSGYDIVPSVREGVNCETKQNWAQSHDDWLNSFKVAAGEDAAIKKIKKQRKLLLLAGAVSAGAGAYLLHCQCNPTPATDSDPTGGGKYGGECFKKGGDGSASASTDTTTVTTVAEQINSPKLLGGPPGTTMGCWLGPLALGQAGIMLYKWHKLGKKQKQLSSDDDTTSAELAANTEANSNSPSGSGSRAANSEDDSAPPSSYDVPCLEDPTQTCQLVNSGTHITTLDGSPPIPLSQVRQEQMAQLSSTERTRVEELIEEAREDLSEINDRLAELESQFQPVDTAQANPFDMNSLETITPPSDTGGGSGSLAGGVSPSLEEDGEAADNLLAGSPGNTPALGLPPSDLFGTDSGDDGNDDGTASYAGGLFRNSNRRSPAEDKQINSMTFGDTKIATADVNLFGVTRGSYNDLRYRGEFIEPDNQGGTVWTPTLPGSGTE